MNKIEVSGLEIKEFRGVQSHNDLPDDVVLGLEDCISSAFDGGVTQEDAHGHMVGGQILVALANLDGKYAVAGFSSTTIDSPANVFNDPELEDKQGAYFAGAAIKKDLQSAGLYHTINRHRLGFVLEHDVDMIFTRTQNPRVQEGISGSLERFQQDGLIVVQGLQTIVKRGVYGKMLTKDKPEARQLSYDDDFDHANGDAKILTWKIRAVQNSEQRI